MSANDNILEQLKQTLQKQTDISTSIDAINAALEKLYVEQEQIFAQIQENAQSLAQNAKQIQEIQLNIVFLERERRNLVLQVSDMNKEYEELIEKNRRLNERISDLEQEIQQAVQRTRIFAYIALAFGIVAVLLGVI